MGGAIVLVLAGLAYLVAARDSNASADAPALASASAPAKLDPEHGEPEDEARRPAAKIEVAGPATAPAKTLVPGQDDDVRAEAAAQTLVDHLNEREGVDLDELFAADAPHLRRIMDETLEYHREALGHCEPVVACEGQSESPRFVSRCERGSWEIQPRTDIDGRIVALLAGASDVEPTAAVYAAAERALDLRARWDPERARELFVPDYDFDELERVMARTVENWGACSLDGVDLANPRGAIFELDCEIGRHAMRLDLDDEDRLRRFRLWNKPRTSPCG